MLRCRRINVHGGAIRSLRSLRQILGLGAIFLDGDCATPVTTTDAVPHAGPDTAPKTASDAASDNAFDESATITAPKQDKDQKMKSHRRGDNREQQNEGEEKNDNGEGETADADVSDKGNVNVDGLEKLDEGEANKCMGVPGITRAVLHERRAFYYAETGRDADELDRRLPFEMSSAGWRAAPSRRGGRKITHYIYAFDRGKADDDTPMLAFATLRDAKRWWEENVTKQERPKQYDKERRPARLQVGMFEKRPAHRKQPAKAAARLKHKCVSCSTTTPSDNCRRLLLRDSDDEAEQDAVDSPDLCGVFGCQLPAQHAGLCKPADLEKRR